MTPMPPVDGQMAAVGGLAASATAQQQQQQQQSPPSAPGGSISLAVLVDFIIQRTYHELTVLAELLPRKTDMERKIEIVHFANRTRQLFVRLLALVKWANSASKVDKCSSIMAFLDKQSMLFVDTADLLSRMSRETLVHARLPNFQLPCAVEVLTTGSYIRLPTCIRERIVPPDPITPQEKLSTLQRLDQIIQHRLVTSVDLPSQMRHLTIENGRVTFQVEHEFEVSLTLMGDNVGVPWRLLNIVFLVEDKDTGEGRTLVHPLQVQYIHQLAQSRLMDNPTPLFDLYNCLHSFCQSLQLEVLCSQVYRLCRERLGDYVRVEEYCPGKCLTISFWRELTSKTGVDYKLCIQTDMQDGGRPLQLMHSPALNSQEMQQVDHAIKSDLLSFERLLVQTIYIRTKQKLNELREEIRNLLQWDIESSVSGSPAVLNVPILQPCLRSEQLLVTIDTHLGTLLAHVPQYGDAPFVSDIQATLNGDKSRFCFLFSELKFWIVLQRCRKSVQHLLALSYEKLPIVHPPDHPLARLSKHRLYVKLCKHPNSYLVVELQEKAGNPFEVNEVFHLLVLNPSTYEEDGADSVLLGGTSSSEAPPSASVEGPPSVGGAAPSPATPSSAPTLAMTQSSGSMRNDTASDGLPRLFYTVQSLVQFDTFAITHGPHTKVDAGENSAELLRFLLPGKRKAVGQGGSGGPSTVTSGSAASGRTAPDQSGAASANKRPKHPAYFVPNLAHVVAMADERLPFAALAKELSKRGLCHQGLQVEAGGAGLSLRIVQMPVVKELDHEVGPMLQAGLLGCTIRMQGRGARNWLVEYAFCKCPLASSAAKEQGPRRQVYFVYDVAAPNATSRTVNELLSDWSAMSYLHGVVLDYAQALKKDAHGHLSSIAEVKSYAYKRLILGYGPNRNNTVSISWRPYEHRFSLTFGVVGQTASAVNPHTLTAAHLQHHFGRSHSVPLLLRLLRDTYSTLTSVAKLTTAPMMAVLSIRPQVPIQTFTVIPRSPMHFCVSFRNVYCLDVHCRCDGVVAVRDGAYSLFDKSKAIEEFTPTQGLKAFLNKFVDESLCYLRRRSQSEDDNPPSPVSAIDQLDSFMTGHAKPLSPAQRSQDSMSGLRFHHPATPSSGSNPHTPASPHTGVLCGTQPPTYGSSPAASSSFSLASPPHNINPSPSTAVLHMGTPSPGGLLTSNSPGNPLHVPSPGSIGFMPQPSPSGPSPAVHGLQSPASAPFVQQGSVSSSHNDAAAGSPYPMSGGPGSTGGVGGQAGTPVGLNIASPASQNWPGSPSLQPRPSPAAASRGGYGSAQSPAAAAAAAAALIHSPQSVGELSKSILGAAQSMMNSVNANASFLRILPQRSWAAAVPTLLSVEAFDVLCTPAPLPVGIPMMPPSSSSQQAGATVHCSPLERFLGCVYMRRHLQRLIQSEEFLINLPCNEVGIVAFKVDFLHCRVGLNPMNFQTLHLKVTPSPEYKDQWNLEELNVLERFFETRVVCSPYKPNALSAFTRILNAPIRILKDCIQIMRLEMIGDRSMKWSVQWCLTIPPAGPLIAPAGNAAVVIIKNKLLFFIQLTRIGLNFAPGTEPQTVVLPIVYDVSSNTTQLADRQPPPANMAPTSATSIISNVLKRFAEFNTKPGECSIFPAIRELMTNLIIPI